MVVQAGDRIRKLERRSPGLCTKTHNKLHRDINHKDGKRTVCILGAEPNRNPTYDILEANSRIGGRVYTHKFSETPHDYYDIGAMRFPDIPIMKRTFDLFKLTGMPLIPYYLNRPETRDLFNDHFSDESSSDPYQVSIKNGGPVSDDVVDNVNNILEAAFGPYKEKLVENFKEGFAELMEVDDFSTREFLKRGGPDGKQPSYDFFSIQWMETMNTSTNLFDQAFSESVMDSLDFDYPGTPDWYCIDGGTTLLSDAMRNGIKTEIQTEKRVESISIDHEDGDMLTVKCADEPAPRQGYSTVFATPALGCLARMDLRGLELHPSQKDAIRSLHYDDSVKVALQFSYPWWIVDCGIIAGGVASTDLPLRSCVYPSYNLKDGRDKPAVLLASYTWAQDANRMGSLVDRQEDELVELILQNLARLHAPKMTYERIKSLYTGVYHAYSWSHDPTTAGAFALFGPGQFSNLYPYLSRPTADSRFHIVGEAASMHHAWIVGALDSACAAVHRFLVRFNLADAINDLEKKWGKVEELEAGEHGTVHLQVMLGKLRKEDHLKV
ncbi:FAD/NAD(P)-binding domain-containing protein [Annulohypoxylon truncatum]|uniref:FAD/NAD(P)-binding domain-containing protein n=1 Tax=Annulohypoxylon truncatum TaxID=327061 RepID=UPI002007E2B9|nr:FAD/NAD(P)-binding domain-containing protein [Annulohypoxylon truncatum]KAI1214156.1 FAD/NAD(P)-binding domain-containing protein [Annulohypoxylon truncatum]